MINRVVLVPQNCVMVERRCRNTAFFLFLCSCSSQPLLDILFSESWSNSVQLEMPYVCPNGLVRVLSETPPPFLTPPEVRLSPHPPQEHLLLMRKPAALPPSFSPLVSIHSPSGLLTSETNDPPPPASPCY